MTYLSPHFPRSPSDVHGPSTQRGSDGVRYSTPKTQKFLFLGTPTGEPRLPKSDVSGLKEKTLSVSTPTRVQRKRLGRGFGCSTRKSRRLPRTGPGPHPRITHSSGPPLFVSPLPQDLVQALSGPSRVGHLSGPKPQPFLWTENIIYIAPTSPSGRHPSVAPPSTTPDHPSFLHRPRPRGTTSLHLNDVYTGPRSPCPEPTLPCTLFHHSPVGQGRTRRTLLVRRGPRLPSPPSRYSLHPRILPTRGRAHLLQPTQIPH